MSKKAKQIEVTDIPEVVAFVDADARVKDFREQYADVFEAYGKLVQERNQALENAEKVVRAHEVTCGPFDLFQYQTTYDAQKFFEAVGRDQFLKLGGEVKTVPQYSIDKKAFDAYAAQKKIAPSVVEQVVSVSPKYKVPKPISL